MGRNVHSRPLSEKPLKILLVPPGKGTRRLVVRRRAIPLLEMVGDLCVDHGPVRDDFRVTQAERFNGIGILPFLEDRSNDTPYFTP